MSHNSFTEGSQGKSSQLEMLHTERYSYHCDTQQSTEQQMSKRYPHTSQKYPQQIHKHVEASLKKKPD